MADYNTELRKRLKSLVEHFGQAELARRTRTSPSTLSRYLRGTRIPAEFVARAVAALELRPAWILHGEEPPFVTSLSEKSAGMASNLLEIVRAMEATSRMRAGAVFGRSDLRKLDELNRALADLRGLQQRMRTEFEDQYKALIYSVRKAINSADFAGAERLLRAAEVFSELCRDEDLRSWLRSCQAYYQIRSGAPEQAVKPHAQLLYWTLGELGTKDLSVYQHAFNHAALLTRLCRRPEALRLCRAFGALSDALPEAPREAPMWRVAIRAQEAYLQLLSGNVKDWLGPALAAMNELRAWP
ncbi:MAG: helix-turn-helix domain-containing protein, partial [Planctomycetes bacterium]|nr:helix-turn-helix domain-containing protein [Planctomycetota bacterium]